MTDPLLTIEEATREFRVSPKTVRRRLAAGEISGAYKRPGSRGPEWVMPRSALAAAGFAPRAATAPAVLPTDAEERAAYWERRATDAEAALQASLDPSTPLPTAGPSPRRRPVGPLGWTFVGVGLIVGLLAGLVFGDHDTGAEEAARPPAGTVQVVASLLEQQTEPGDPVGLVGARRSEAIPPGRVVVPPPSGGWDEGTEPRFVVAVLDETSPPGAPTEWQTSAALVLRAPYAERVIEVWDRTAAGEQGPPPGDATVAPASPTTEPSVGPGFDQPGIETGVDRAGTAPGASSDEPTAGPPPPALVEVAPGESFWTIAERIVGGQTEGEASEAEVGAYWSILITANADRLVDPGNADLLHVGQQLTLPAVT